jgi:hypothetical protein
MRNILCFYLGLVLSALFLLTACSTEPVEYYHKIHNNNFQKFTGSYPISKDNAMLMDCYHFEYDESDLVISIEFLRCGRPVIDSLYLGAAKLSIQYLPGYVEYKYYDVNDALFRMWDCCYTRYEVNEDEHYVAQFNYDSLGNLSADSNGVVQYRFENDVDGQITKIVYYDEKGSRVMYDDYIYDIYEKQLVYNEDGTEVDEMCFNKNNELIEIRGYYIKKLKYDKNGKITKGMLYNSDKQLIRSDFYDAAVIEQDYDSIGNLVSISRYGIDGKLINSYSSNTIEKRKYDTYGRVVEISAYDVDLNLTKHAGRNYAVVKYEYDSLGNRINTTKYDKDLNEIPSK